MPRCGEQGVGAGRLWLGSRSDSSLPPSPGYSVAVGEFSGDSNEGKSRGQGQGRGSLGAPFVAGGGYSQGGQSPHCCPGCRGGIRCPQGLGSEVPHASRGLQPHARTHLLSRAVAPLQLWPLVKPCLCPHRLRGRRAQGEPHLWLCKAGRPWGRGWAWGSGVGGPARGPGDVDLPRGGARSHGAPPGKPSRRLTQPLAPRQPQMCNSCCSPRFHGNVAWAGPGLLSPGCAAPGVGQGRAGAGTLPPGSGAPPCHGRAERPGLHPVLCLSFPSQGQGPKRAGDGTVASAGHNPERLRRPVPVQLLRGAGECQGQGRGTRCQTPLGCALPP